MLSVLGEHLSGLNSMAFGAWAAVGVLKSRHPNRHVREHNTPCRLAGYPPLIERKLYIVETRRTSVDAAIGLCNIHQQLHCQVGHHASVFYNLSQGIEFENFHLAGLPNDLA
jgi:hypothetical protein